MRNQEGHSLVELLATIATLAALLAVAGGLFRLASRTAALTSDRAEALDATRTAAALLDRELRTLGGADVTTFPDSLSLRAFRGYAVPCDTAGTVRVRFTGARPPDPTKDSIIALTDSAEVVAALTAASPTAPGGGCAPLPGEQVFALAVAPALPPAAAWLVYERGTYSIGGGALRYRRGFGGRQPVTAPVFDDARSAFAIHASPAALGLLLSPAHTRPRTFSLPSSARIPLPNADTGSVP